MLTYICFGIFCFVPAFLDVYENWQLKKNRKQIGTEPEMTYRQIYEELEYKELGQEGKIL